MSPFHAVCCNQYTAILTSLATLHLASCPFQVIQCAVQKGFELPAASKCFDVCRVEAEVITASAIRIVKP